MSPASVGLIAPILSVLAATKLLTPNSMTQAIVQDVLSGSMDMIGSPEFQGIIESIDQAELKTAIKALDYRREFLSTPYWKHVAKLVKDRDGHECRLCCSKTKIAAHHRSYRHHGEEHRHMEDLVTLCEACHQKHHDILPFPERYPEAPPATIAKEVDLANPDQLVLVTKAMADSLIGRKRTWHWMLANGYEPNRKGWRNRIVGKMVPAEFFQESMPRKGSGRKVDGMPAWTWIRETVRNHKGHDLGAHYRPTLMRCLDAVGQYGMEAAIRSLQMPHKADPDDVVLEIENLVMAQCGEGTPSNAAEVLETMIAGKHALGRDDCNYFRPALEAMLEAGFDFDHFLSALNREASLLGFMERSGLMGYKLMMRSMRVKSA